MHKVFTCLEKGGVTGCWDIKRHHAEQENPSTY